MKDANGSMNLDRRRSTRVLLRTRLLIYGVDSDGKRFEARGETVLVNKHGARLRADHNLCIGSQVTVAIPNTSRQEVATVISRFSGNEYGVALSSPANLWGVSFPPEDWSEAASTPSCRGKVKD